MVGRFLLAAAVVTAAASVNSAQAAWTEQILKSFGALGTTTPQGSTPWFGVLPTSGGALFGVTQSGGKNSGGVAYEVTSGGKFQTIYSFFSDTTNDTGNCGYTPSGTLARDSSGILYGTTVAGGKHGLGAIFQLKESGGKWSCSALYSFSKSTSSTGFAKGYDPYGGLLLSGGILYGTTSLGGKCKYSDCKYPDNPNRIDNGGGVVFSLTVASKAYKVLYTFQQDTSGYTPAGPLLMSGTTLYGATFYGGAQNSGAIYKLTLSGGTYTFKQLYKFDQTNHPEHGYRPAQGALAMDGAGNLYGETLLGGCGTTTVPACPDPAVTPAGVVFKLTPGGTYSLLKTFDTSAPNFGYQASGGLLYNPNSGSLYGVTQVGGGANGGVVFRIKAGSYLKLHDFIPSATDGMKPSGPVVFDASKSLVGVTFYGGVNNGGVLFRLTD